MLENELGKFQQELVEIKQDLLKKTEPEQPADALSYQLATKLDIAVTRLLHIIEYYK